MRRAHSIFLVALTAACGRTVTHTATVDTLPGGVVRVRNTAPSAWSDSTHITFTELTRIQPAEGQPGQLDDPAEVVVDDAGRIYVSERAPVRIDQYAPDGKWIRTIGRQGGGPGEYQVAFLAWAGGHLVVHDPQQRRTSLFDTSGVYLRSWASACCVWSSIGADTAGRAYIHVMAQDNAMDGTPGWIRFRDDGTAIDTLWRRPNSVQPKSWEFSPGPGSRSRFSIPFQPQLIDVPWPAGGVIIGDNSDYSITLSRNGRDTARVFSRTWTPAPISDSVRKDLFDRFTKRSPALLSVAHLEDIPVTEPAFGDIVVDDAGWFWVDVTRGSDHRIGRWDVFSADGVYLGPVVQPFRRGPTLLHGGKAYVLGTDGSDIPYLAVYKVNIPTASADR